jgi:hypothetical protein
MATTIKFELDEEQTKKYHEWRANLPKVDYGAIGGGYQFIFIPTGLGDIVKVKRDDGHELQLTDTSKW